MCAHPRAPLPAAMRSAPIATNQIQLRAGGSTNAPASTSPRPTSDNAAQMLTVRSLGAPRSRSMRTWSASPRRRTITYGTTNHNTSAVNASVTDVAMTNAIAVATSVSTRTKL